MFHKKEASEFLHSVDAIPIDGPKRTSVDPEHEWRQEDWQRYTDLMNNILASGAGLNLPTGYISCGEDANGINPWCNAWTCSGKAEYQAKQQVNPDSMIIIKSY